MGSVFENLAGSARQGFGKRCYVARLATGGLDFRVPMISILQLRVCIRTIGATWLLTLTASGDLSVLTYGRLSK